jgi:hypothetical protein
MKRMSIKKGAVVDELPDSLGNPVRVGDIIAYATTGSGRQPFIKLGKVLELRQQEEWPPQQARIAGIDFGKWGYGEDGVFKSDHDSPERWWWQGQESILKGGFGNVLKMRREDVPAEALEMLDGYQA